MIDKILVIDALSCGSGKRVTSRDAIGCGPRTVAGVFEKYKIPCRIKRAEEILQTPRQLRGFDHIAISAMSMDLPTVALLIRKWRKVNRGRIILGGPITSGGKHVLQSLRPDVMVLGEGERTLAELITRGFFEDTIELSDVRGTGFLQDKTPVFTQRRPFLSEKELSTEFLPSTYRIIDYSTYQASKVYVEVLRGCSNFLRTTLPLPDGRKCSDCGNCKADELNARLHCPEEIPPGCGFCSVPHTWGAPRSKEVSTIISEVAILLSLGVHRVVLEAPDFLDYQRGRYPQTDPCKPPANLSAIRELLSKLMELPQFVDGLAHLSIENIKACLFTEEVAATIAEFLPSASPNIGLESGSSEHIRQIGKCGSPTAVLKAVRIARKYRMHPFVYFIYGLPGETPRSVNKSIRFMEEISKAGAERIILYPFQPLPGSAFSDFPPASKTSRLGRKLQTATERINRRKKENYLGSIVHGIAAEPSLTHHGYTMVYPLKEGPIMTVPGGFSPGTIIQVRITRVLSAGLVLGEVVK